MFQCEAGAPLRIVLPQVESCEFNWSRGKKTSSHREARGEEMERWSDDPWSRNTGDLVWATATGPAVCCSSWCVHRSSPGG